MQAGSLDFPWHIVIHISFNDCSTERTRHQMFLSKLCLSHLTHQFNFPLSPRHVVYHCQMPSVNELRQLRYGYIGLRQVAHVYDCHIMNILVAPSAIRDKHANTTRVSALQDTTPCHISLTTHQSNTIWQIVPNHYTGRRDVHYCLWRIPW